mmetsp:Transcript_11312/g.30854  ORF Transcript_11312/g.30854 Transcript_11312/m.30854 type:complete len:97 (+) Transcript_11312:113-403(+)
MCPTPDLGDKKSLMSASKYSCWSSPPICHTYASPKLGQTPIPRSLIAFPQTASFMQCRSPLLAVPHTPPCAHCPLHSQPMPMLLHQTTNALLTHSH